MAGKYGSESAPYECGESYVNDQGLYIHESITTSSPSPSNTANEAMPSSSTEHDATDVLYRNISCEPEPLLLDDGSTPYPDFAPEPSPAPPGPNVTYIEQPTKGDWESAKPLIRHLWVNKGLRLAEVRRRLEAHGFPASESMYKKHLQRWAKEDLTWRKQKYTKSAVPKRNRISASSSPSMSPAPMAMPPPHPPHHHAAISPDLPLYLLPDQLLQSLLMNVSGMYRGALHDGRWKMRDALTIQENEYDELFLIIFKTLHYSTRSDAEAGDVGMREAFPSLRRAVHECGFFSLPTIWTAVIHIVRRGHMQFASRFIAEAARLAGLLHPNSQLQLLFVDMLRLLAGHDAGVAEHALVSAYTQCIRDVTASLEGLPFSHLTALALRNFFVHYIVYVDGGSAAAVPAQQSMRAFEDLLELSEQIYDKDDEVVIEILAHWIMCLELDPAATHYLAQVTNDMLARIASRRRKLGGTFKWNLLPKWRGVKSVLFTIHARREVMEWLTELAADSMNNSNNNNYYNSVDVGPRDLEEASRTHLAMWRDKTMCGAPLVYT